MSSAQQPLSLKHTEAQERAGLLDVTAYDVALDLDRGEETFGSVSTITLRSQGGPTFVEVQPVTLTDEPWAVRRFFVEDPGGTIVNVLAHIN